MYFTAYQHAHQIRSISDAWIYIVHVGGILTQWVIKFFILMASKLDMDTEVGFSRDKWKCMKVQDKAFMVAKIHSLYKVESL